MVEPLSEQEISTLTEHIDALDSYGDRARLLATIRELQTDLERANAWGLKESVDPSTGAERIAGVSADLRVENVRLHELVERALTGLDWWKEAHPEDHSEADEEFRMEVLTALAKKEKQ